MPTRTQYIWLEIALCGLLAVAIFNGRAAAAEKTTGDTYTLNTCPVMDTKLDAMAAPVVYDYEGREIRFCCKDCEGKFKADPATYITKIDAAMVKQQIPYYPLDTCLVTGEKLGANGQKPIDYVYNNRLVRLLNAEAVEKFKSDPATYLAKLDKAVIEKQKPGYPLDTCVVSGEKLGAMGSPIDYVVGNRLVRFCCQGCVGAFTKNPLPYLKKLDAAAK
ncbi:MAG TPA: hypothetical protein VMZ06_16805 [Candidatus Bathyarchaeia archaeon]|nr:hypothetical protein [Candidatus Bathyarchaeia archaeon]